MFIIFCSNITNSLDERNTISTDAMEARILSYWIEGAVENGYRFYKRICGINI